MCGSAKQIVDDNSAASYQKLKPVIKNGAYGVAAVEPEAQNSKCWNLMLNKINYKRVKHNWNYCQQSNVSRSWNIKMCGAAKQIAEDNSAAANYYKLKTGIQNRVCRVVAAGSEALNSKCWNLMPKKINCKRE